MRISSELTRIIQAKSDIRSAIEEKGVTVPVDTKIDGMAALIREIDIPNGFVADIVLASNFTDNTATLLHDARLTAHRNDPTLTVSIVPKTSISFDNDDLPRYYIGFILCTNHTIGTVGNSDWYGIGANLDVDSINYVRYTDGLTQEYSVASGATSGHPYIDENGNMRLSVTAKYVLGAGEYLITVSW